MQAIGKVSMERGEMEANEVLHLDESPVPGGCFKVGDVYKNANGEVLHVTPDGDVLHTADDCEDDEACPGHPDKLAEDERAEDKKTDETK